MNDNIPPPQMNQPPYREPSYAIRYGVVAFGFLMLGLGTGFMFSTPHMLGLDCASAVIQHGEVRCIAFVDRTYKP